jgi:hypothetical protein
MTWKLYGLPFTNYEDELDPLHKLWVWELPTKNQKYVVSMDCGGGLGQDRTVIQVVRLGNPYQPAAQVAEYATDLANAFECWSVMLMLLQWYSPHKYDGSREYALASIEMAADGRTAQNEIFKRGWPNIYIRQKSDQRKVIPFEQPNLGWDTNQSTRAILISWIQNFVKRHQVIINSPWVLDELRDFVMHVTRARDGSMGQIKVQAGRDAHDSLNYGMGANCQINDNWQGRFGFYHSSKSIPDSTWSPSNPESSRNALTLGTGYSKRWLTVDVAYNYILFSKRTVHNSIAAGTINGSYETTVHVFAVGLTFRK